MLVVAVCFCISVCDFFSKTNDTNFAESRYRIGQYGHFYQLSPSIINIWACLEYSSSAHAYYEEDACVILTGYLTILGSAALGEAVDAMVDCVCVPSIIWKDISGLITYILMEELVLIFWCEQTFLRDKNSENQKNCRSPVKNGSCHYLCFHHPIYVSIRLYCSFCTFTMASL